MKEQYLYAALKLIEGLVKDKMLEDYIFTNILNEYSRDIDISKF